MKRTWTLIALSALMISGMSNCGAYTPAPDPGNDLSFQNVTEASGQTETKSEEEPTVSASETVRTETKKATAQNSAQTVKSDTGKPAAPTEPEETEFPEIRTNENGDVILPEV